MIVSMWMTRDMVTVGPSTPISEAAALMARKHVRRLPVVERDTGKLLGMVSLDDLLKARTRHMEEERRREKSIKFRFRGKPKQNR